MSEQPATILKKQLLHKGVFLSMYQLNIQLGDDTIQREIIERRDGVSIVPVDEQHNVLLIKEYSAGSNSYIYTLPGGQIDANETPEVAALRELREETGYSAMNVVKLRYAYAHPTISTRKSYTFLAYDLIPNPLKAENEYIQVYTLPLEDAIQLMYQDFASDIGTIGNLLMARDKLREIER